MSTTHHLIVTRDTAYAEQFPDAEPEFKYQIECSSPAACDGWIECIEDHAGFDPNDPDSPACDEYEDVEIHGVLHEWKYGHGWTVDYPGCPVMERSDCVDEYPQREGRFLLDEEWDDTDCYLTIVEAAG